MAVITSTTDTILSQRARLMRRAWQMFKDRFNYPRTPFRSIGRHCFNACLKAAWAELKEIVRLAGFGIEKLREAIARVSQPHNGVGLSTAYHFSGDALLERARQRRLYEAALLVAETVREPLVPA